VYQSRYCCIVVRCSAVLMCPFKGLISMSVTDCCQNLWLLQSHVVSDVRLGIVFVVFICYFVTVFLCLPQARVAGGGGMFSCCPFVRLFVRPFARLLWTRYWKPMNWFQYKLVQLEQGSHGSWKVVNFEFSKFMTWKVLKLDRGAEKVMKKCWNWLVPFWKTKLMNQ